MNTTTAQRRIPGPTTEVAHENMSVTTVGDPAHQNHIPASSLPALVPARPQLPVTGVGEIAGAISAVMSEVGEIDKGGFNKFHNYHYARMEDLLRKVTPLIGKHGLAIIQNEISKEIIETRVAVVYEFSIFHKSGEMWPERPRFTGMAMARDSKGNFDDKCVNKAHTAARKYFLLSLFQVPAVDEDADADEGSASNRAPPQQQRRGPVPGPGPSDQAPQGQDPRDEPQTQQGPRVVDLSKPCRIVTDKAGGVDLWIETFIKAIGAAKDEAEVRAWDAQNSTILEHINKNFAEKYDRIFAMMERRLQDLVAVAKRSNVPSPPAEATTEAPAAQERRAAVSVTMPNPKTDVQVAVNWVAQQLNAFKTYEAAELFWNHVVAPREAEFNPVDFEVLLAEWKRTDARLAPEQPSEQEQTGEPTNET